MGLRCNDHGGYVSMWLFFILMNGTVLLSANAQLVEKQFKIVVPDLKANTLVATFNFTGITSTISDVEILRGGTDFNATVRQGNPFLVDLTTLSAMTVLDKTRVLLDVNSAYSLVCVLITRQPPFVQNKTISVPVSQLITGKVRIPTVISEPATEIQFANVTQNSSFLNTPKVNISKQRTLEFDWNISGTSFDLDDEINLNVTIQDNAMGGVVVRDYQGFRTFSSPFNAVSTEKIKILVQKPNCTLPSTVNERIEVEEILYNISGVIYLFNLVYKCKFGYTLEGADKQRCVGNNMFDPPVAPTCLPVECNTSTLFNCANSEFDSTIPFNFDSPLNVSCGSGYRAAGGEGMAICHGNQTVTAQCPNCTLIPCNVSQYSMPKYGRTSQTGLVDVGGKLTVECQPGYEYGSAQNSTLCLVGPKWKADNITCQPISCGQPPTPNNSNFSGSTFTFGSSVTFSCSRYYSKRSDDIRKLTCNSTGEWSGRPIVCDLIPCNVSQYSMPKYGRTPQTGLVDVGGKLAVECQPGYEYGSAQNSTLCLIGPKWQADNITCQPISCGQPPTPNNSNFSGSTFTFGSSVTFSCNRFYHYSQNPEGTINLTCTSTGEWSGRQIDCKPKPCRIQNLTSMIQSLNLVVSDEHKVHFDVAYNKSAEVTCRHGYNMSESDESTFVCGLQQKWGSSGNITVCTAILCNTLTIENGKVAGESKSVNATMTLTCDSGFEASSSQPITCQDTGIWSPAVTCNALSGIQEGLANPVFLTLFIVMTIIAILVVVLAIVLVSRYVRQRNSLNDNQVVRRKAMPAMKVVKSGMAYSDSHLPNDAPQGQNGSPDHALVVDGDFVKTNEAAVGGEEIELQATGNE